ncbi:HTH-type transcriptional regulator MtrR [Variovorax sp. PBL-H6]|nr:HTH-type transcriptional regulator MtrR [Variovorax sp. PBL-H6]
MRVSKSAAKAVVSASAGNGAGALRRGRPRSVPAKLPARGARAAKDVAPPVHSTERIVEAAVQLFATRGYASSTLEEVAAKAGFTKGAVYYYFKSKERLLLDVLSAIEQRSIDATVEAVRRDGGTPSAQLVNFVRHQTRWAARHPKDLAVVVLLSMETANRKSKVRTRMLGMYAKISRLLEEIIDAGKRSGEFCTDQETKDTALYLQAVHDGNMMIWYRSGTDPDIGRKLTRATFSGFLHAVKGVAE